MDAALKEILEAGGDFAAAQSRVVTALKEAFGLSRVTIMLYNKSTNMLESVSAAGVPNVDHRDIRAPVIRIDGISSRAVEARAFLENRPIVIRDRSADPQYRMRRKFPHKTYSREFAIFPLSVRSRKLGVLAVSNDEGNPAHLTRSITGRIARLAGPIAKIVYSAIPKARTDREMAGVLNDILQKELLWMAFQPIVDIGKRAIHGYEALLRVNHPVLNGPEVLIGCAEKFNTLRDLSFFAHSTALRSLRSMGGHRKLFLNLHPRDFVEYENLDRKSNPFFGRDLSQIVFEITERYCLHATDRILSIIRFFKGLGVGIALDDLGSGYSSLEVLAGLEPDYIKLDMSLIRSIHQSDRKQKLVRSLLYYSDQIGAQCVAEGVETKEEYDVLKGMKCRLIQGFLLAMPSERPACDAEIKDRLRTIESSRVVATPR